jgi:hypothetical protein
MAFLNGEKFAKKAMIGNTKLMHQDASVSMEQLGRAMLAVAFLASEESGATKMEIRDKKVLLGLRKTKGLFVDPMTPTNPWPSESLEAAIYTLASRLQNEGDINEVSEIIVEWLAEDRHNPWPMVFELVKVGMASRGLL